MDQTSPLSPLKRVCRYVTYHMLSNGFTRRPSVKNSKKATLELEGRLSKIDFSAYCSYLLIVWNSMKLYGLALILFYMIALRAAGGVERLEMAVYQAMHQAGPQK